MGSLLQDADDDTEEFRKMGQFSFPFSNIGISYESDLEYLCFLSKQKQVSIHVDCPEWAIIISVRMSVFNILITFICRERSSYPASDSSQSMVGIPEPSSKRRR